MRSWICRCRARGAPRRIALAPFALLSCAFLLAAAPAARSAAWDAYPWLTIAAGYENDRLLDPDLDRFALPGGSLLGLTPGIRLAARLGDRTRLDASGQVSYERFQNSDGRSVLGGVAAADVRAQVARSWLWRCAAAGNYYSDSVYETAERIGGGFETGFGFIRPDWSLELLGGAEGRRYDNLVSADDAGVSSTYSETGLSLGLGGWVRAGAGAVVSGRVLRQRTDARDPLYDAGFWLAQGALRAGLARGAYVTVGAMGQMRGYSSRPQEEDSDSYWQLGAGLERELTERLGVTARYAFARVSDPLGVSEDLHRVTLAATLWFGRSPAHAGAADLRLPAGPSAPSLRENDVRLFRCSAPGARQVALVGDFNGWDPAANPLRPDKDGWWQAEVRLPVGSHQYAYVVDGETVAPADAEAAIDDGFGGRNGLIRVEPAGL